jgi:hypothetical protein
MPGAASCLETRFIHHREGEAPAEPRTTIGVVSKTVSAGASPSPVLRGLSKQDITSGRTMECRTIQRRPAGPQCSMEKAADGRQCTRIGRRTGHPGIRVHWRVFAATLLILPSVAIVRSDGGSFFCPRSFCHSLRRDARPAARVIRGRRVGTLACELSGPKCRPPAEPVFNSQVTHATLPCSGERFPRGRVLR